MAIWVLNVVILINLAAFCVAAWDKAGSKFYLRRVPEKNLLLIAAVGGGPGLLLAFYLLHHKIRKKELMRKVWILALFWVAVAALIGLLVA